MTAEIHSGAHGAPESFDSFFPSSEFPHESARDAADSSASSFEFHGELPARGPRSARGDDEDPDRASGADDSEPAEGDVPAEDSPEGEPGAEGVSLDAAGAARKRRRRGSRGGRRRRGRREGTEEAGAETALIAVPVEPPLPGEDESFDTAPLEPGAEADPEGAPAADGTSLEGPRRRRSRRGRGGRGRGEKPALDAARPATARTASADATAPRASAPPRVRAPRGSVPREIDALDDEAELALDAVPDVDVEAPTLDLEDADLGGLNDDGTKRRRRGNRGGRRRKKRGTVEASSRPAPTPVEIEAIPGEDDDLPRVEVLEAPAQVADAEESTGERGASRRRRRGRGRGVREGAELDPASDPDAPRVVPESERRSLILVNATDPEEQRVAVLEDGKITDFLMTVKDQDTLVNDIYRGRVVNLEPAIGAAFIDFGQGRNGFLHTSDVLTAYGEKDFDLDKLLSTQIDPEEWDENSSQPSVSAELDEGDDEEGEAPQRGRKGKDGKGARGKRRFEARPRLPITDLLKKGQTVVVQVTKDAIGDKGPTLTTYISIPGRYLVLMPSMSRTGVSRKIEDEKERKRLKRILQTLEVPKGMGVIVRTAGVGHSKNEIKRDLDYLVSLWTAFGKKLHQGHGPAALYRESDVAIKTMRDLYSTNTKAVIVDDPEVQRQIVEFTEKLMPEDVARVQLHDATKPLFQAYNVEPDFERIFQRRIELASGGSIVFDQAEALVAIDVNSGRTRSDGFDFEDIALKTNLEAAPEIARQMRLRDLGGIIVVDFIDMMKMSNIRLVEKAFKEALESDRARSKIGRISQFGLLEMTRQRLGPGMDKKVFHHCPRCRGTGRIRTVNSRAAAILRRLSSALTHKGFQTVEVRAHPEVVAYLKSDCSDHLRALEYRLQKDVRLIEAADQPEDSVLRYLRVDGREVRPGGRRKR
ncbi:MAG: Rne/Rng family ribonuclease [Planctomycetota bacterium]|nr:Rne/Rng family ribonuclease [Planctomycetota bacterium]